MCTAHIFPEYVFQHAVLLRKNHSKSSALSRSIKTVHLVDKLEQVKNSKTNTLMPNGQNAKSGGWRIKTSFQANTCTSKETCYHKIIFLYSFMSFL